MFFKVKLAMIISDREMHRFTLMTGCFHSIMDYKSIIVYVCVKSQSSKALTDLNNEKKDYSHFLTLTLTLDNANISSINPCTC